MGKLIITEVWNKLFLFLMDEQNHPQLIRHLTSEETDQAVGNIFVGRVSEVASGLSGAFVSISSSHKVFLPFRECESLPLHQGDELLVQITSPALKTKLPAASAKLCLTGRYCVCQMGGHGIAYSQKLSGEQTDALKRALAQEDIPGKKNYRFTIRTNAGLLADQEPLFREMKRFVGIFDDLSQNSPHRTAYSCLYRGQTEIFKAVSDISLKQYEEAVTDIPQVYDELSGLLPPESLRLYQDKLLPLPKLYSLETHLKQALSQTVWLPSGGYLIIEPTEAMTVIDVNSGKGSNDKKTGKSNLYLKTNLEAAKEIARQLRLRNLSGMIMVDFINMKETEDQQSLLSQLDRWLKDDPIKTRLVDMTALGIVEITRKKESCPLSYALRDKNIKNS